MAMRLFGKPATYLIGAGIPATFTVCQQNINWGSFGQCMSAVGQGATYNDYIRCQQQNSYESCYTYYASTNGQSDAFIKAPSQSGYNSAWANNAIRLEAQGVNHLEMDRHPTMRDIYESIFNGTAGANGFFVTQ